MVKNVHCKIDNLNCIFNSKYICILTPLAAVFNTKLRGYTHENEKKKKS